MPSTTPIAKLAVSLLVLVGCGGTGEPAIGSAPSTRVEEDTPSISASRCLPLVSGCGCAYQCAFGQRRADGRWEVTHNYQDSRVDVAMVERWCFDPEGHAFPQDGAPEEAARCVEVFFDLSPCGGECVPSVPFSNCALSNDRCAPSATASGASAAEPGVDADLRERLGAHWDQLSEHDRQCHREHPSARIGDGVCESLQ